MSIDVAARTQLGAFTLDARFVSDGRLTAIFGPSGSGKSTLINVIAGLLRPEEGRIVVDDAVLLDTVEEIDLPPYRRRIGYVFQEARLFPHLSVRQNLLYGRWFVPRAERRDTLHEVVALLGLEHLLARAPGRLSGGEKQRVAIGRALLASPRLLLMDEPLSSLDEERKEEVLPFLERLRDRAHVPILYVSHSIAEVTRLATTIVLLSEGRVTAVGSTAELMGRLDLSPLSGGPDAGAILDGRVEGHDTSEGLTMLRTRAGLLRLPLLDVADGTSLRVRIRARDVTLALDPPIRISALNALEGHVTEIGKGSGSVVEVALDCGGTRVLARITRHSLDTLALAPGEKIYALIKSIAFDRRSIGAAPGGPAEWSEIEAG